MHNHDHYHLAHHHRHDGMQGEWEHRTYWHTHEHNQAPMTHTHDYPRTDEGAYHARDAHVHHHNDPTESPA